MNYRKIKKMRYLHISIVFYLFLGTVKDKQIREIIDIRKSLFLDKTRLYEQENASKLWKIIQEAGDYWGNKVQPILHNFPVLQYMWILKS